MATKKMSYSKSQLISTATGRHGLGLHTTTRKPNNIEATYREKAPGDGSHYSGKDCLKEIVQAPKASPFESSVTNPRLYHNDARYKH